MFQIFVLLALAIFSLNSCVSKTLESSQVKSSSIEQICKKDPQPEFKESKLAQVTFTVVESKSQRGIYETSLSN